MQTTRHASSLSHNMAPLMTAFTSLSVVTVTILSPAMELRTGLPLDRVQELPAMPQELQVLPAMPQRLPLPQQVRVPPRLEKAQGKVQVLPVMPQRLPLPQQVRVLPRLEKALVQVQGKVQAQGKAQDRAAAKRVVVACIWATVNPALGVTTNLWDVTCDFVLLIFVSVDDVH
jgi:hypothetical protein